MTPAGARVLSTAIAAAVVFVLSILALRDSSGVTLRAPQLAYRLAPFPITSPAAPALSSALPGDALVPALTKADVIDSPELAPSASTAGAPALARSIRAPSKPIADAPALAQLAELAADAPTLAPTLPLYKCPPDFSYTAPQPSTSRPRAAVLISGDSRSWTADGRFADAHANLLIAPLLNDGFDVHVVLCLDAQPATRTAAETFIESISSAPPARGAATVWARVASATSFLFDLDDAELGWPQYARLAHCRACAASTVDDASVFVAVRPDLLVQDPLPRIASLARAVVHSRVRAAVSMVLLGAHMSFHFDRAGCWDEDLPPLDRVAPEPWILPDDALLIFFRGAPADAVFGAFDAHLAAGTSAAHDAAGAARGLATPCAIPLTVRSPAVGRGIDKFPEAKLHDAVRCAGVSFAPLAITARLPRHVDYGSKDRCYAFDWPATCPQAAAARACAAGLNKSARVNKPSVVF